jgi:hypothetical protein
MPFALLIDTQKPTLRRISTFGPVVAKDALVRDTVLVSDNVGNVQWRFRCAQGGVPYALGDTLQGKTLKNGHDTAFLEIKMADRGGDATGARAEIEADDGHLANSLNLSRRVYRERSDEHYMTALRWTPLRVTAVLDNDSAGRLVHFIDTTAKNPTYDTRYLRLMGWLPTSAGHPVRDHWVEYAPELAKEFEFSVGRLFWVKTLNRITLNFGHGITLPLDSTVSVPLNANGWTDIALPFRYTMRVGDIIAATRAGGSTNTDSLIFYQWSPNTSGYYSCTLLYNAKISGANDLSSVINWQDESAGFTVHNPGVKVDTLRIPPIAASLSSYSAKSKRSGPSGWMLKVFARTGSGAQLGAAYCGADFADGASPYYFPLPPSLEGVRVGVVDEKSGALYGGAIAAVASRAKKEAAAGTGGFSYLLALRNETQNAEVVTLGLEELGNFPSGYSAVVFNGMTGKVTEIKGGAAGAFTVSLDAQGSEYRYLIVGDAAYIGSMGGMLGRERLALDRIYPNPLRGMAHLRYSVPFGRVGRVEFSIFDISGRVIWRRAIQELMAAGGSRECLWSGTSNNGKRVATGVYIVKMRAFDYKERPIGAFEQRITLLR